MLEVILTVIAGAVVLIPVALIFLCFCISFALAAMSRNERGE